MKPLIILSLLLMLCSPASAAIYQWKDEYGNVVYGDQPPAGTEKKELKPAPLLTYPAPARQTSPSPSASEDSQAETQYTTLEITSPQHDQTIRDNAGSLTVTAALTPNLDIKAGHRITLLLDGQELTSEPATRFTLQNVERGSHQLQLVIIDRNDNVIKQSPAITFHLLRYSKLH